MASASGLAGKNLVFSETATKASVASQKCWMTTTLHALAVVGRMSLNGGNAGAGIACISNADWYRPVGRFDRK
jgi:hypothetical protein